MTRRALRLDCSAGVFWAVLEAADVKGRQMGQEGVVQSSMRFVEHRLMQARRWGVDGLFGGAVQLQLFLMQRSPAATRKMQRDSGE
jgi:hypothetical protein